MDHDLAARAGRRRLIEHHRRLALAARPGKGDRVGAVKRLGAARRCHAGHIAGAGEGDEALLGEGFGLWPERGEVIAVHDPEDGNALLAGLGDQRFAPNLEGQWCEAVVGVDLGDPRCQVVDLGCGVRCDLAALHRRHVAGNAEQAVRLALVALCRGDRIGDRRGLVLRQSVRVENFHGQAMDLIEGETGEIGHGGLRRGGGIGTIPNTPLLTSPFQGGGDAVNSS